MLKNHHWLNKEQKKVWFIIVLSLSLLSLLSACSPASESPTSEVKVPMENFEEKIKKLIQARDYEGLHQFFTENRETIAKEEQIEIIIQAIAESDNPDFYAMVNTIFRDLVDTQSWDLILKLIKHWETDNNAYTLQEIESDIEKYLKIDSNLQSIDTDKENLLENIEQLKQSYPHEIAWTESYLQGFSGYLAQQINDWEYRVIDSYTKEEFVLVTFETEFTSPGDFSINVLPGETKEYTLQNGFSKPYKVLYEVPDSTLSQMNDIMKSYSRLEQLAEERVTTLEEQESLVDRLKNSFDNIFLLKGAQERVEVANSSDTSSSILTIEDHKFHINGISLGHEKEQVLEKWGNPIEEKVDEEYSSDFTNLYYDQKVVIIYDNTVDLITMDIEEEQFDAEILQPYKGEKYINQNGDIYLYEPISNQLIIFKEENGKTAFSVLNSDGNFDANVNDGYITKIE
ncbi:hypothetical protein [Planococcus sp. S3-L1]|uniref:hypothetical protein n=1 Tax=Planococcus sp. S3-L1 TaxID=3046200 RepID=UPI0024BB4211|nr:hypothetical protein [Planococcus sp. S3-L1]MDJ0333305.1 hypothetical protein [Planococcus sp. S3-L1]